MTDKELDALIKDALTSEKMPASLNQKLLARAQKRAERRKKIIYISKWASSMAAVFICGIAVLSYFNSSTSKTIIDTQTEKTSPINNEIKKEAPPLASEGEEKAPENRTPKAKPIPRQSAEKEASSQAVYDLTSDAVPKGADEAFAQESSEVALAKEVSEEAIIEDALPEEDLTKDNSSETKAATFGRMKAPLFSLFEENYDFKSVIYNSITKQLQESGKDASNINEISGYEDYRIEHDGALFIIFPEGSIAPYEKGQFEFFVGRLENGILN